MAKNSAKEEFIVALIVSFATVMLGAWALMLTVGNIHESMIPALHPIGYWDSVFIVSPFFALTAAIRVYNRD
jgi:hypothetical protein